MPEPIIFDSIELIQVPVVLQGKRYVLQEPSFFAGCRYRDALINRSKTDDDGNIVSYDGISDVEIVLVSECLFEDLRDAEDAPPVLGNKVSKEVIGLWPDRIARKLYAATREIGKVGSTENVNPT